MGRTLSFLKSFLPYILLLLFSVSLVSVFYWSRNFLPFFSYFLVFCYVASLFCMSHFYDYDRGSLFFIFFILFCLFCRSQFCVSSRDRLTLQTNHTKQYKFYMQTNICVHVRTYMQTYNYTCKQTNIRTYKQACLLFPLRLI